MADKASPDHLSPSLSYPALGWSPQEVPPSPRTQEEEEGGSLTLPLRSSHGCCVRRHTQIPDGKVGSGVEELQPREVKSERQTALLCVHPAHLPLTSLSLESACTEEGQAGDAPTADTQPPLSPPSPRSPDRVTQSGAQQLSCRTCWPSSQRQRGLCRVPRGVGLTLPITSAFSLIVLKTFTSPSSDF